MIVLAAVAVVITFVLAIVFLIAIVIGIRQAHPTDLALRPRTHLEARTRRVVGLYVRKGAVEPPAGTAAERDRVAP
jgi:hypothetical protein